MTSLGHAIKFGPGRCQFCGGPNHRDGKSTARCFRPGCQPWVDTEPKRVKGKRPCQGYACTSDAFWNRWAGFYCYPCAIKAGWLPGVVQRHGDQLVLS